MFLGFARIARLQAVVATYTVKAGSARDGGKAGPLGRKIKVEFETTGGRAGTVIFPKDDVASWLAALNGPASAAAAVPAAAAAAAAAPALAELRDLPYGGDMNAAMHAQDRAAIKRLMAHQKALKDQTQTHPTPASSSSAAVEVVEASGSTAAPPSAASARLAARLAARAAAAAEEEVKLTGTGRGASELKGSSSEDDSGPEVSIVGLGD
jgi:hypothetical protein